MSCPDRSHPRWEQPNVRLVDPSSSRDLLSFQYTSDPPSKSELRDGGRGSWEVSSVSLLDVAVVIVFVRVGRLTEFRSRGGDGVGGGKAGSWSGSGGILGSRVVSVLGVGSSGSWGWKGVKCFDLDDGGCFLLGHDRSSWLVLPENLLDLLLPQQSQTSLGSPRTDTQSGMLPEALDERPVLLWEEDDLKLEASFVVSVEGCWRVPVWTDDELDDPGWDGRVGVGEKVGSTGLSGFGRGEEEAELLRSTELFEAEGGELEERKKECKV